MNLITDNQLPLIILCFLLGCAGSAVLFLRGASNRTWRIADLVWVLLGGFGALTAVLAGLYQDDSSQLDRQIDVAFAATREFDSNAARFRLAHCETTYPSAAFQGAIRDLCNKVEFLSASTATNAALPLFIGLTEKAAPLQGLHLFFGGAAQDMADMAEQAATFDTAEFLAFAAQDDTTKAAVALLREAPSVAGIAAEYQVIARAYEDLIADVAALKQEWDVLQAGAGLLTLQVIAICLVALAAPLRLGKSVVDLS